ncbi:MAG: alanine--tRNA ligase [Phycisphaerae bacterium]
MPLSKKIRSEFIKYFEKLDHTFVPSSQVVPKDDPTLLFANAGMNQFKDVFLGIGTRPYTRAANTQKCIRVSGKHNDLEQVGTDTYHHTFFEMLGNWSFGDYFKADAIAWAWKLLTQVWGLPKDRLYATVFAGDENFGLAQDNEAIELWKKVTDIDPTHILPFGQDDNFWQMADTGPCGPCSEIHIDLTPDKSGGKLINAGDARVIEIWNLVFIQYNRDANGGLDPLPARHVDTGMGLERICAVIKHLDELKSGKVAAISNYGTDLFVPIIAHIEEITGCNYGLKRMNLPDRYDSDDTENIVDIACRVIADHIRTLIFAIADGAQPSNEGRGYVLRRLLRRAARFGRKLNVHEPFIYKLVPTVIEIMGGAFPELASKAQFAADTIRGEEEAFGRTLDRGLDIFELVAAKVQNTGTKTFPAEEAFKLYDTYGFPLDLTQLMARERGYSVDEKEFERLMGQQRDRARSAEKSTTAAINVSADVKLPPTGDKFKYGPSMKLQAHLLGWLKEGAWFDSGQINSPAQVDLVFDHSCFYGEQGGQIGDTGKISTEDAEFIVEETIRVNTETVLHRGKLVRGKLQVGQLAELAVDAERRNDIMNNHTATHLLQWALRQVLGDHVKQAGSLVSDEYLRFDFTNPKAMTDEEIRHVEKLVVEKIDSSLPVISQEMPIGESLKMGVTALFGEKYGQVVRVLAIGVDDPGNIAGAFSAELCGGTHINNTAKIMNFKIIREESLQTGVRRITARTGRGLRTLLGDRYNLVDELCQTLKVPSDQLQARVTALLEDNRKLKKQSQSGPPAADLGAVTGQLLDKALKIDSATVVIGELPHAPIDKLRSQVDWLKKKAQSLVTVLGSRDGDKVQLLAAVSDDLIGKGLSAGKIIEEIAKIVGGGGGGRDQMAQAGGKIPDKLPEALAHAEKIIREKLNQ